MTLRKIFAAAALALCVHSANAQYNMPTQTFTYEHPYAVEKLQAPKGKKVKNVILMIGDGMSLMHVYTAWAANRGKLWLENAQATGLSKTWAVKKLVTDSGSGGTSLATGVKTVYHAVGVDPEGKPLTSLVDVAKKLGKDAGMAVTCRLWDATPCDFCCHNIDRDKEEELVGDYPTSGVDFVFGGGAQKFTNRKDGRDIFKELQKKGYHVSRTLDDFFAYDKNSRIFAVPYDKDTPLPDERGDLLARASMKGISLMNQNKNGFFMMIEGSQLDDYGHFNQLDLLMKETLDFDQTVGEVMKWAAKDGETLVVVTADHETGGLTLVNGNKDEGRMECCFSTKDHSGAMVPVYAFGPGAENFTGIFENTDVFKKIKKLMTEGE
ncbi:alkaline phosphatase [Prevotella sp.]|uniref:alkaline phosphatase n=1 Tax=Prevotella sp. TaxID=59823 RepID=UPI0025DF9CE9|nr:alkaline phosphatase [Prevotella sp.]